MNRIDTCPACHHQIIWLPHSVTKKSAPIDFATNEDGNVVMIDEDGDQTIIMSAVVYRVLKKGEYAPMPRHTSHFASCKFAARFRGKK